MQNDEAGCLPLINSWITIWQSLIIYLLLHTVQPTCKKQTRIAHHWKGYTAPCTLFSAPQSSVYGSISFFWFGVLHIFCLHLNLRTACLNLHCSVCSIVGSCCPADALALVLNCSSPLSHWPGNTHSTCSTYQKCFVTRPAGASLLWLNHWSRLQPVGHTFNHLSCCSFFKPVNNIECKNAIHRRKNHNWRNFEISQK